MFAPGRSERSQRVLERLDSPKSRSRPAGQLADGLDRGGVDVQPGGSFTRRLCPLLRREVRDLQVRVGSLIEMRRELPPEQGPKPRAEPFLPSVV